jgi:peptidoglycan/xylan/chitin deacetylase (PgdA/CDA1 family)
MNLMRLIVNLHPLSYLGSWLAPERLGPLVAGSVLWRVDTPDKRIALTFDDGPHPENTPRLVELLDRLEVKATFFLIGKHIESYHKLAETLVSEGHQIENHTWSHAPAFKLSDDTLRREIRSTGRLLRELSGVRPAFLRPPMGLFSKRVRQIVESEGYRMVIGDVYPRDPHKPGKERILQRVLGRVRSGSIIILHDGGNGGLSDRSQTLWAVEKLIPELRGNGFRFVTLTEHVRPGNLKIKC